MRYTCTTIYVDQATNYTFVYMQKTTSSNKTVNGNEAFERHLNKVGVEVKHYHADNNIFAANEWREYCHHQDQKLTFAEVGAHHTNGVAEAKIKNLQSLGRTMMIHAN